MKLQLSSEIVIRELMAAVPLPKKYRTPLTQIIAFEDQYLEGSIVAAHPDLSPLKLNTATNKWEKIKAKRRKK